MFSCLAAKKIVELHYSWTGLYLMLAIYIFQPAKSNLLCTRTCQAVAETLQNWCQCKNNGKLVNLSMNGITLNISNSHLGYYFDTSKPANVYRCPKFGEKKNTICMCRNPTCISCDTSSDTTDTVCIHVDRGNNVIVTDIETGDICNATSECTNECNIVCHSNSMETLPPDVVGRRSVTSTTFQMITMTPVVNITQVFRADGVDTELTVAGSAILILITILVTILILFCRKKKIVRKKKESSGESVYSTIDENNKTRPNGYANDVAIIPNRTYDAMIDHKPNSPVQSDHATHYKSLPAIHSPGYIPSEFKSADYQPYLPKQQAVWKNDRPTLFRYPTVDAVTGYTCYNASDGDLASPTTPYMYLKKSTMTAKAENQLDKAKESLPVDYRPGYKVEQHDAANYNGNDNYDELIRDHRSLPAEGNKKESDVSRNNATYGFEKRKPPPQSFELKPIPARRGAYRSQGDIDSVDQSESNNFSIKKQTSVDSEYDDSTLGKSDSHYYVTVVKEEPNSETDLMMDNPDYQKSRDDSRETKTEIKTKSKRNPKPRTRRRQRRRPTTEVTCEMTENPLASSHDEDETDNSDGHYTADDLQDGMDNL